MAFKKTLSEFSRAKLVETIDEPWFVEMLEVLRNSGSFSYRQLPGNRPITEMEYQSLNNSYREGFISCAEYISTLTQEPKEPIKPLGAPFGTLQPITQNPKELNR